MSTDLKYWLGFAKIPSIGPNRFQKITNFFSSLEQAWHAPLSLLKQTGLEEGVINQIIETRPQINLDAELEKLERAQVKIITLEDADYPKLLKEIYAPPPIIFYRGSLPQADDFLLAVVGTRKFSIYGQQATISLTRTLAEQGLIIVSGLALGIDSLAHNATLDVNGKTIAVLGSGIESNNIYPVSNRNLAEKIIGSGGCVLSEHPLGTPPLKPHFPRRNRIIAGLSLGTLVVEAPEKSGALITAQFALEQNREVFAVPGNITSPASGGTNNLIKMGARAVTHADDILECLNLKKATEYLVASSIIAESAEEEKVLNNLKLEPLHVDELTRLTELPISTLQATLTIMEMKGKVRHLGAMKYVVSR